MNKEVIKKYKKEFEWWLFDGEVLVLLEPFNDWVLVSKNHKWEKDTYIYVLKDRYVEFRKALAEGKTVQDDTGLIWSKSLCKWDLPPERYRIKPDEPEFKVGNYVVIVSPMSVEDKEKITQIVNITENGYFTGHNTLENEYSLTQTKLWTLEDANNNDWVCYKDSTTSQDFVVCSKNYYLTNHIESKWVYPYIGQTPKQLGLEK